VHGAGTAVANNLQTNTGQGSLQAFIQNQVYGVNAPQAYLNIIFFDENFNFVSLGSAGARVTNSGDGQSIPMQVAQAPKNGYAFVYVSNESVTPVFFDNLEVYHTRGRLVEENTYYPYGLKIKAMSAKAYDAPTNPYQYQGDYAEFDEETGYNEFELRDYDPQLGRFIQTDPYEQFASGYVGMGGDPVNMIDEDGGWSAGLTGALVGTGVGFAVGYAATRVYENLAGKQVKNKAAWGAIGALVGAGLGYGIFEKNLGDGSMGYGTAWQHSKAFWKGLLGGSGSINSRHGADGIAAGYSAEVPDFYNWDISGPDFEIFIKSAWILVDVQNFASPNVAPNAPNSDATLMNRTVTSSPPNNQTINDNANITLPPQDDDVIASKTIFDASRKNAINNKVLRKQKRTVRDAYGRGNISDNGVTVPSNFNPNDLITNVKVKTYHKVKIPAKRLRIFGIKTFIKKRI
jgi:RHS repeat-associated protein